MKSIKDQNYYEILEVSPTAMTKEIHMAYERVRETFHPDSAAIYSLFSEDEMIEIQAAIEEAYRVLMDEDLRKRYDQVYLQKSGEQKWKKSYKIQGTHHEKTTLSFRDFSLNVEEEVFRGKTLKKIRERMGIDLKTISDKTKINVNILEWIEEEVLEKIPALVYLKGFLRGYAQSLGLDTQKVVEGYLQFLNESKKK